MATALQADVDQPTRVISHFPNRISQAESSTIPSDSVVAADDADAAQRLASELAFVNHFAPTIGSITGMKTLCFGLLEDHDGQAVFAQTNGAWTGRISSTRRTIKQAKHTLMRP